MLRDAPPHGLPELSRRSLFATLVGILGLGTKTPSQGRPDFHVRGVISESQEPDIFYIGVQFGLIAAPKTEPHRLLLTAIGKEVKVYVELV